MLYPSRAAGRREAGVVLIAVYLLLAVAAAPGPARAGTPTFTLHTLPAGLDHEYSAPGIYGPGVAAVDFDDDGDLDLFVANDRSGHKLYRNEGDGTFQDVAPQLGLDFITVLPPEADRVHPYEPDPTAMMPSFVDTDNDGDKDFFLSCWNSYCRFFENNGDGTFTDRSVESGLAQVGHSATAAFGDFDRDSDLDLYVVDWGGQDHLYRNNGDNTWTDISRVSGIRDDIDTYQPGWCAIWMYHDDDLWPDLFVGNDYGLPNLLYRNNGGRLVEAAYDYFPELSDPNRTLFDGNATMGQALGDYDHDGDFDLFVANSRANDFYRRDGNLYVNATKMADQVGPGGPMSQLKDNDIGWFCDFPDVDNDGWVDLLLVNGYIQLCFYDDPYSPDCESVGSPEQPNRLWRNVNGSFVDVTASSGFTDVGWSKSAAVADFDQDGDVDIFVGNSGSATFPGRPSYFRNDTPDGGHWLTVRLRGTLSNRDGYGAQVRATTGDYTHMRDHWHSSGYLSQRSDELYFGLGEATVVDVLTVTWPSGVVDTWRDVPVDQRLTLVEDSSGQVPVLPLPSLAVRATEEGVDLRWTVDASVAWQSFRVLRRGGALAGGVLARVEARPGREVYGWVDPGVAEGEAYTYRIEAVTAAGSVQSPDAGVEVPRLGAGARLLPARPNPFNPRTTLRYRLPEAAGTLRLRIVDALGRVVTELVAPTEAGWHEVSWDGTDAGGRAVASGAYRALLQVDGRLSVTNLTLVR